MRIEISHPFYPAYKVGYVSRSKDGRQRITLLGENNSSKWMSYARYLLCVKEGRILTDDEEADHRDDDRENDDINNLRILTPECNKHNFFNKLAQKSETYDIPCKVCGTVLTYTQRDLDNKERQKVQHIFCSRSCSARFHVSDKPKISNETISRIKELRLEGKSSYTISKMLFISRNTVMKYW